MSKVSLRQVGMKKVDWKKVGWRQSDNTLDYPNGAILFFDAATGFVDQAGNQPVQLIGSAYPTVTAGFAINETGKEWGFDTTTGPVKAALESGELTLVQVVTLPLMSSLTDETDYSLFGDLLFVRRDGTAGSFKCSDGTNTATVGYDWSEGEVVRVCVQADGDVMRIGIAHQSALPLGIECGTAPMGWWGDSLTLGFADDGLKYYGNVLNYGVGGETSTQIKSRLLASTMVGDVVVIWAGNNNPLPYSTVMDDVAAMVADFGHDKYLIVGMLINAIHAAGSDTKTAVLECNAALSALYGPKFLDMQEYLKTEYDPEIPQDVTDVANGITPSSLRADDIHLNATGQNLAAKKVYDTLLSRGYVSGVEFPGTVGNCVTLTSATVGAAFINILAPAGHLEISSATVAKIQNSGTCVLRVRTDRSGVLENTNAGTFWNIRITLTDGSVVVFPVLEGAGTTLYGYVEGDGAVYVGFISSGIADNGIATLWTASQDVYFHDKAHGYGLAASGQLGPERIFALADRDFSSDTGRWSKGTAWEISGGVAAHTSATATTLVYANTAVIGARLRTGFSVAGFESGIIGLSGGTVAGGFYKSANGDYTKDFDSAGVNLTFYATGVAAIDNVSVREIYTSDARIPANPYNPGYDCAGNPLAVQPERPGFGPWSTLTAPLPLSAQITKGHALPIGTGKITVFDGVASQGQIEEAK